MVDANKKDENEGPSFEMVLEKLGPLGKYQMIQVTASYLSMFFTACIVLSFVFEGYEPSHVCNFVNETKLLAKYGLLNDSTAQIVYGSCEIRIAINQSGKEKDLDSVNCPKGRNFSAAKDTTFLAEWDLVCESSGVAEVTQTCFNVGQIIGGLVGTIVADQYGRKPVITVSSILALVAESSIIAAPNIFVIYGLKFVSGLFYQALVCCFFVFATEFILPRHREANGVIMCLVWVFAMLVVGAIGYFFRNDNWRYFQGGVGVMGSVCLMYPFVLSESPRWLASNGKKDEALSILKKASKMNGQDFEEIREAFMEYYNYTFLSNSQALPMIGNGNQDLSDDVMNEQNGGKKQKNGNVLDLLRVKSLRKTTLISWYLFLTNILTYFGIYMTSSNVAGNRFLNFTLLNLVEIPSNACIYYMMKKMNRRYVLMIFLALTGVSLMMSTLLVTLAENLEGSKIASTALFIFGKFTISSSFNVIFIIAPEIFPTKVRTSAMGLCLGLARFGAMVAPFLRPLYLIVKWGPGLIFTVMCLLAVVLTIMLPESKDTPLSDNIDGTETGNKNG